MLYRLLLLPLLLVLAACQTTRLERDFDASRDFAAYRSWSWQEPAVQYVPADPRLHSDLTTQRVREAVAQELDQRGLRPAQGNPDLKVQVWMLVEQRQDQVTTVYGGGGYWGNPWGFWGAPGYAETSSYNYRVGTLQIDLFDGRDGKLVWRGSAEQVLPSRSRTPTERRLDIYETVTKVLSQYPPY
jgi:hypothetical protein